MMKPGWIGRALGRLLRGRDPGRAEAGTPPAGLPVSEGTPAGLHEAEGMPAAGPAPEAAPRVDVPAASAPARPGLEAHGPDFPAGGSFYLFHLYGRADGNPRTGLVEREDAGLFIDLTRGELIRETTFATVGERGAQDRWRPDVREAVPFDALEALIAGAEDEGAAFYAGMNASNWRDYVARRFREKEARRPGEPIRVREADLLPEPTAIEALYVCVMPPAVISYFRRARDGWKLFRMLPGGMSALGEVNYAARFAEEGERAVEALKCAELPQGRWYDRILTPLERRYLLSQLQFSGLYERERTPRMPALQPCYQRGRQVSGANRALLANVQAWYVLEGARYYLADGFEPVPYGRSYGSVLSGICAGVIAGCELAEGN